MSYKPISLSRLISEKNHSLFLPHIQRPFVWDWEQITKFLDSLMKNYPIQTLLLWKTKDSIKTRKFLDNVLEEFDLSDYYDPIVSKDGYEKTLVLDGQQRLQSLFAIFSGQYMGQDIYMRITDGDVELDNGLNYDIKSSAIELNLPYIKLSNLALDKRNAEDIADSVNDELSKLVEYVGNSNFKQIERTVRKNIGQLISILREDKFLWIEELDGISGNYYDYSKVLNIFIRVNSGGTKLSSADLMFAIMKEGWEDVEENIDDIADMINSSGKINFDKDFILKALIVSADESSSTDPKVFSGDKGDKIIEKLKSNWDKSDEAFKAFRDFITNDLCLYSERVIRSYNAFIPIADYLFKVPNPSPENRQKLKSYFYSAQLFNWYSSSTDKIIDACHNFIKASNDFPLLEIKSYFKNQSKRVNFVRENIFDNKLRFIILNLIYVEKFGTSPFNVAFKKNEPNIDHIYPKSKLFKLGYESKVVNFIGNYRYVGQSDNLRKRAQDPIAYFSSLQKTGIPVDSHLLVKEYFENVNLLTYDNYTDFKEKRTNEIFSICNRIINVGGVI